MQEDKDCKIVMLENKVKTLEKDISERVRNFMLKNHNKTKKQPTTTTVSVQTDHILPKDATITFLIPSPITHLPMPPSSPLESTPQKS